MINCSECEHFFETNSTLCCDYHKFGFKYHKNRMLQLDRMSRKCMKHKKTIVSEFSGPITDEMLSKFEVVYKNTSKSVRELQKEHKIYQRKWSMMAREITKRTGYIRPNIGSVKEDRYIIARKGAKRKYYLVKYKNEHYGHYWSKEMATLVRDALEKCNWNKEMLDDIKFEAEKKLNDID